ncbi:MAG: serine/threonine protein kinase [Rhodocyclaceae bacterium]|jgi:Ser/Thr protein kinase RdoA (MazF antagonist)|nr:serine/threonine protein kinase [Rhodocyclaceae bacterium]
MTNARPCLRGSEATPYAGLTPDRILDAIESTGLRCDGRMLTLNSFENRVYQIGLDDGAQVVAKFYRDGRWSDAAILEEHAFTLELAAREIPVVPPRIIGGRTLHAHGGHRFAVFTRQGGRAPEFDRPETLEWMGRFLGRIHAVGELQSYAARPALDIAGFGDEPRDFLLAGGFVPEELETTWLSVVDQALAGVERCFERAGQVQTLRLHGDCHQGNVLWTDGPHFVDFDDSRSGPAVQDLWMLLSGNEEAMGIQLGQLLRGYEQFREFDDRELYLIEALRTLRLIHYSAWIARRWDDPAFPAAFPWFGTERYWQDRILELREQIPLMDESPIRPA